MLIASPRSSAVLRKALAPNPGQRWATSLTG
jgi:hypothetical protein